MGKGVYRAMFVMAAFGVALPAAAELNNQYTAQGGSWNVYKIRCSGCHGVTGEGRAPVAPPLNGNAFLTSSPPAAIKAVIRNGRKDKTKAYPQYGQPGGYMSMIPFPSNVISDRELDDLVTYLKGPFQQGRFNN